MVDAVDVAQTQLDVFHKNFQSLVLATLNERKEPYTSYAPFAYIEGNYYILVSSSAPHYHYIKDNNQASIFLVEDEGKATNPFFRKRLSYYVDFKEVDNEKIKQAFIAKFGNMAEVVLNMDFHTLKVNLKHGKLIIGPGQAYYVDQDQQITAQDRGAKHSRD